MSLAEALMLAVSVAMLGYLAYALFRGENL